MNKAIYGYVASSMAVFTTSGGNGVNGISTTQGGVTMATSAHSGCGAFVMRRELQFPHLLPQTLIRLA